MHLSGAALVGAASSRDMPRQEHRSWLSTAAWLVKPLPQKLFPQGSH